MVLAKILFCSPVLFKPSIEVSLTSFPTIFQICPANYNLLKQKWLQFLEYVYCHTFFPFLFVLFSLHGFCLSGLVYVVFKAGEWS